MSILATSDGDEERPPAAVGAREWDNVVDLHEAGLRRLIAGRMADKSLVDDALQETYLRAVRRCRVGGRGMPDERWWRTVARRASTDVYRSEPPPGVDIDRLAVAVAVAGDAFLPGSDEHLDNVDRHLALRWALARLSPRHRRLLALRGVYELSYQEIAAAECLTEEAVTAALNRARTRLRSHLRAYDQRRAAPVVGLWLGSLGRRLRWRLQELGPRLAELAGAGLAVGVVAAMTVPGQAPPREAPAVLAGSSRSAVEAVAAEGLRVGEATRAGADATAGPRLDDGAAPRRPAPPPPPTVGVLSTKHDVRLERDEWIVRHQVEVNTPVGLRITESTELYCSRSRTAAALCPVVATLPGVTVS